MPKKNATPQSGPDRDPSAIPPSETPDTPETEYYEQITDIAKFLLYLLGEKDKLFAAIRKAKDAGCDDFMAKPFRVEDLLDIVQKYIKA